MSYRLAGVHRDRADELVQSIAKNAKKTLNKNVKSSIGGYASLYKSRSGSLLAASTDGVGTKLKIATELGIHHTVGIDLVAMSVNDLLCVGAKPSFFLDYFATGKLDSKTASSVIAGIIEGCKAAECSLVGGETAEMPGFYESGEYDLAGFAVGEVSEKSVLPKKKVRPGSILLGLPSSGFHSNGFSLLRRSLPPSGKERKRLLKSLLTPTRIYVHALSAILQKNLLLGAAHITGSGFLNVPRISDQVSYEIKLPKLTELPEGMSEMLSKTKLGFEEEAKTFNLGIGMVLAIDPANEGEVLSLLRKAGERPRILGKVIAKRKGKGSEVHLTRDPKGEAWIAYS